jgi:hypothetical protein
VCTHLRLPSTSFQVHVTRDSKQHMSSQSEAPALVLQIEQCCRPCPHGCYRPGHDSACPSCTDKISVPIHVFSDQLPRFSKTPDPEALTMLDVARLDYDGFNPRVVQRPCDSMSSGSCSYSSVLSVNVADGSVLSIVIQLHSRPESRDTPHKSYLGNDPEALLSKHVQ